MGTGNQPIDGDWYAASPNASRREMVRLARSAAVEGAISTVHGHARGEDCGAETNCVTYGPLTVPPVGGSRT